MELNKAVLPVSDRTEETPTLATWLVRLGSASNPLTPPWIVRLDEVERLVLGRSDAETAPRPAGTHRCEADDPWMSAQHAELLRTPEGWRLSDLGSSNGTLIWGQRCSTGLLSTGDVFETGSTFWMFRAEVVAEPVETAPSGTDELTTISPRVATLHRRLAKVAQSRVPLVIRGPTGCGKEVLARAAHRFSGRSGRLITLDLGIIPPQLLAQELYGVEPGVPGERPRAGRLRAAHGGTVILDQLADMSPEVQVALLRVIQDGEVTPVGADRPVKVDLRFVCTTHEDVEALVAQHRFRPDLWARLRGFVIEVPPLAARLEDMGLFVGRFLERLGLSHLRFSPAAYRALLTYRWPHDVRELARQVESAAALSDGKRIELTDLSTELQEQPPPRTANERSSEDTRERELLRLLAAHRGNVSAVARSMGYSRMQVHRWMKQMDVDPNHFRSSS